MAWYTLNCLIGNFDHAGGMIKLTTYDRTGGKPGQPFHIGKLTNGKNLPFGIDILRTNTTYEKTTLFAGYPSKRPWFPLATDIYQEDVPSMGDAYPYPIKIAMFYMSAINYSLPAGHTVIEILADPKKIPLVIVQRHPGRRDLHVRRLHLPGCLVPGTLGVPRLAPLGAVEGGERAPARHRAARLAHGQGVRRRDPAVLRGAAPGASPRSWTCLVSARTAWARA